jgi:Secretion system C-terminal sorting domain
MMKKILLLAISTSVLFMFKATYSFAQCNINQLVTTNGSLPNGGETKTGQSFTPTCTGILKAISFKAGNGANGLSATINVKSSCSSSTILSTKTITVSGSAGSGTVNNVTLTTSVNVTANTTYYFEIVCTQASQIFIVNDDYNSGTNFYSTAVGGSGCTADAGSDLKFSLTIDAVMPVELMSFDAQTTEGGKTQLTWATGSEINSHSFDIERSQDGKTFAPIGNIKAQGKAANYAFVDNTPLSNTSYYRLKAIDNDQTFEYSKVISVQQGKGKAAIHIYPTTTQNVLTVENNGAAVDVVTVFNQVGQLVFTAKQVNRVDMSGLPAGLYLVQVQAGSEKVTEKVFKQ